ncbi:ATP-binding protein [Desulfofustis limnaeus]|jgi:nitrogen-specific signal transduction histidine kinase|uniref:histidine kinase n=1 Tax=Desulfofustis limnaeus TaxID=2740163 RepID=A0ABM7WEP5_9BACT|nr:ATP-binding protein [Desulfofustis limnaeus]MDX9894134.1 ATP-binding protein [Desulfofustis sp.]BDD89440.1 hypothetical protein DPPLL_38050 [Desulfofustis limnaeus]
MNRELHPATGFSPSTTSEYAVVCCDTNDVVVSWDAQAGYLFGHTYDQAVGKDFFALTLSDPTRYRRNNTSSINNLFRQHRKEVSVTIKLQERAVSANRRQFPVELIISPLPGNEFFTIFIRNLEYIKKQRRALVEQALHFEIINTVLQKSLEPLLLKDRLRDILTYLVNLDQLDLLPMAALFLVGPNAQSLNLHSCIGLKAEQLARCKQVDFGRCRCGTAARTNRPQFFPAVDGHECSVTSPHGHYCIPFATHGIVNGVICFYVPASHKRSERQEGLLVSAADVIGKIIDNQKMDLQLINLVNDLRASIIALREEKLFSDSIIQGLEHGLVITDPDGIIQKANTVAQEILHAFTTILEGKKLGAIIGEDNARRVFSAQEKARPGEEKELVLTADSGDEIIVRYSAVTRRDNTGQTAGTIISLTDISEWRSVRKEMEKMNRLSTVAEIASAVAHEVRNPLAGIKIMAQSIEENSCTLEERTECAQRIIRQVDRLNELLTDFFSYARPVIPKKQPTSLTTVLSEIKPLIINKLIKQRITLVENFEPELPLIIADPNQIQQVFLNLFLNSVDAIKQEGTIEIAASALSGQKLSRYRKKNHLLAKHSRFVLVTFMDNGAGMSGAAAEKVFEPFFTTKSNGSGLGMSIVYRTLKENDATISVESTEGKGTTFSMFFKAC